MYFYIMSVLLTVCIIKVSFILTRRDYPMKKKIIICLVVVGLLAVCLCACNGELELPDAPGQPGQNWW